METIFLEPLMSLIDEAVGAKLVEFEPSILNTRPFVAISEELVNCGGGATVIERGKTTEAETESVTVKVSSQVPTVAVSPILKTTSPAVDVSIVIPGISGDRDARYVGVPKVIV